MPPPLPPRPPPWPPLRSLRPLPAAPVAPPLRFPPQPCHPSHPSGGRRCCGSGVAAAGERVWGGCGSARGRGRWLVLARETAPVGDFTQECVCPRYEEGQVGRGGAGGGDLRLAGGAAAATPAPPFPPASPPRCPRPIATVTATATAAPPAPPPHFGHSRAMWGVERNKGVDGKKNRAVGEGDPPSPSMRQGWDVPTHLGGSARAGENGGAGGGRGKECTAGGACGVHSHFDHVARRTKSRIRQGGGMGAARGRRRGVAWRFPAPSPHISL